MGYNLVKIKDGTIRDIIRALLCEEENGNKFVRCIYIEVSRNNLINAMYQYKVI